MSAPLAAFGRHDIAGYLAALIGVYTLIIFAWVILSLLLSFGVRIPYSRPLNAVIEFLRVLAEPPLRAIRRVLPMVGPLDLSPMVAILALQLLGGALVRAVNGR